MIGNTPLVQLNYLPAANGAAIFAKMESFNPGGSVKDRIAYGMIKDAEEKGLLKEGYTIVEPTSGNTGIGIALVCAVRKYKCILTMPETMSLERIYILKNLGAEIILTPGRLGMEGSIQRAKEILAKTANAVSLNQFDNPANPKAHVETTAVEIWNQMDGQIDAFVAGVGTGGTITGVGQYLKNKNPAIRIVAVEPETSAVLSGQKAGPHRIQGIGAGFVPSVLDKSVIDEIVTVNDKEAYKLTQSLSREEGLFCGISSGAALVAAQKVALSLGSGKRVVTLFPDTGERYFSIQQYYEI